MTHEHRAAQPGQQSSARASAQAGAGAHVRRERGRSRPKRGFEDVRARRFRSGLSLVLLFAVFTLPPPALADNPFHRYLNPGGMGDFLLVCNSGDDDEDVSLDLGGVCIPAGHVLPDETGQAQLDMTDGIAVPVSGLYCQPPVFGRCILLDCVKDDVLATKVCVYGRLRGVLPADVEWFHFCGNMPLNSNPQNGEVNWDPERDIVVFVDGAVKGNAFTSPCGTVLSAGTSGEVDHTP